VEYRCDSSSGSGWSEERRDESDLVGTKPTRARRPRRRRRVEDIFFARGSAVRDFDPGLVSRTVGLTERREIRKGPATLSRFPRFPGTVRPSERTGISTGTRRVTKTRARGRARVMSTAMHATPARAKIAPRVAALGAGAASRACPVASARVSRSRRGDSPVARSTTRGERASRPRASARDGEPDAPDSDDASASRSSWGVAAFTAGALVASIVGGDFAAPALATVDPASGPQRETFMTGVPVPPPRRRPPRPRATLTVRRAGDDILVQREHPLGGVHHELSAATRRVHAEHHRSAAGRRERDRVGRRRAHHHQLPRHRGARTKCA
jgi:hypothetical protein